MFDFKEFKPPTIPRFLCFNLVTGNLVAAWLHFAGCIFIFAGLLFFLITNKSEVKGEGFEIKVDDASIDENSDAFTGTLHVGESKKFLKAPLKFFLKFNLIFQLSP